MNEAPTLPDSTPRDSTGKELPPVELPSAEKLRVYGDALFLAFRSGRHTRLSVGGLRASLEPAIETGQFRVYRFDDVPRGMYTWARLTRESERRMIAGEYLYPDEWVGGDRLWIMDFIVPYRGLTAQIARWLMIRGNMSDTEFLFRRFSGPAQRQRIVHVDFTAPKLSRTYDPDEFLNKLA
ncbi:toxin-activating lysine-acyltransferase [Pontibaca methylaminivorans]|uniref:RTX toxin-activating lysine-acyltransferase n=1 Tax=Pontibaca methylaminivorans TaxID=515897 RepID=A0A1R3WRV9_9RHOB|nr:toxin-activating lysine-acyltransferase [Pontibaca methylaminivorans]SIT80619.1 cytolysin-activating lysine-acyltransferase [Pontibaca methylaminivorans]